MRLKLFSKLKLNVTWFIYSFIFLFYLPVFPDWIHSSNKKKKRKKERKKKTTTTKKLKINQNIKTITRLQWKNIMGCWCSAPEQVYWRKWKRILVHTRSRQRTALTLSQAALLPTLTCVGNLVTAYTECFHINKTISVLGLVYTTSCNDLYVCSSLSEFFYTIFNFIMSHFIYLHQCYPI